MHLGKFMCDLHIKHTIHGRYYVDHTAEIGIEYLCALD